MILQALTEHYEDLRAKGDLSGPGWGLAKVTYSLDLHEDGSILQVSLLLTEQKRGKKAVLAPREIKVPLAVKRTVGIAPNFLWDNSSYLLGVDNKENPTRTRQCFDACKALHQQVLKDVDNPGAKALLCFFEAWDPTLARLHPALTEDWDTIISGCNLVFRYEGQFLQDIPEIASAWEKHYLSSGGGPEMTCLITGKQGPVESIHPAVKGVRGAQPAGAALVSFNAPAFCSYGKEQNYNAPTSQYAAFAYTAALNHLLSDRDHVVYMGNTAVLCWAKGADPEYQGLFTLGLFGDSRTYTEQEIQDKIARLAEGKPVEFDEMRLDPTRPFYILGISPNAARLSVRFFLRSSFGLVMEHVNAHHKRMEIIRPRNDPFPTVPLWKMLDETVNQNARDKSPSPELAGEVLRAILEDSRYPATLLNGVQLRIRAEREISRGRAAIIKAYYLRNPSNDVPKEVLKVSLNPESTNIPYNLGRLFSVLEDIQQAANPNLNSTIRDKYFNSASATPATIFPILLNLAQKHLRKISVGLAVTKNRQLEEIMTKLPETFPSRLNLPQQGAFQLGYYHQTQARYQGKDKKEEE